jgi:hypothetical protein
MSTITRQEPAASGPTLTLNLLTRVIVRQIMSCNLMDPSGLINSLSEAKQLVFPNFQIILHMFPKAVVLNLDMRVLHENARYLGCE